MQQYPDHQVQDWLYQIILEYFYLIWRSNCHKIIQCMYNIDIYIGLVGRCEPQCQQVKQVRWLVVVRNTVMMDQV